jgi:hypothetical protein
LKILESSIGLKKQRENKMENSSKVEFDIVERNLEWYVPLDIMGEKVKQFHATFEDALKEYHRIKSIHSNLDLLILKATVSKEYILPENLPTESSKRVGLSPVGLLSLLKEVENPGMKYLVIDECLAPVKLEGHAPHLRTFEYDLNDEDGFYRPNDVWYFARSLETYIGDHPSVSTFPIFTGDQTEIITGIEKYSEDCIRLVIENKF